MELTPELKARWIRALRSGHYTRATGFLKTKDGCYCPLGVLLSICHIEPVLDLRSFANGYAPGTGYDALPANVEELWCRFDAMPGGFAQAADWIEANL